MAVTTKPNPSKMLSTKDAAERLGIAPRTLREYADARTIQHFRFGKKLVFDEKDLEEFKEDHKVRTG